MAKQPYTPARPKGKNPPLGRPDSVDEERPFAEIRKVLYDALRMVSVHRWAFFVPFSVVSCAAFIMSLYYPRTYRATTSFERKNDPVMFNLPMSAGAASFKYFRNTMVRDLTSVENMAEVVTTLGMDEHFERDETGQLTERGRVQKQSLARTLGGTLRITPHSPSEHLDIITVTYTGPDPNIGRKLVDEVKRNYIRRTMAWIHDFLLSQRDYFRNQAEAALGEVKKHQREDTRLRLENPHVDPVNPQSIAQRLSQLELEERELIRRKRDYEAELEALQLRLAALDQSLSLATVEPAELIVEYDGEQVMLPSEETRRLTGQIRSLDREILKLKEDRGMTDMHPEISSRMEQRRKLHRRLAASQLADEDRPPDSSDGTAGASRIVDIPEDPSDMIQRTQLLAQVGAQQTRLRDVNISLDTNATAMAELEKAKREVFQKREEFVDVTGKVAKAKQKHQQLEATLASIEPAITAIEQNRLLQFSEGQPARGSSVPISPSAKTVVLLAVLAGLATGVVFVIMAEVFDHVYRTSNQVARSLGLPMLESIDEIVTAGTRRTNFLKRAVLNPLVIGCFFALIGLTGSMAYLSIEQPWTYEKLRAIPQAAVQLFAENADDIFPDAVITTVH